MIDESAVPGVSEPRGPRNIDCKTINQYLYLYTRNVSSLFIIMVMVKDIADKVKKCPNLSTSVSILSSRHSQLLLLTDKAGFFRIY